MKALCQNTNWCLGCGGDLGTGKAFSLTGIFALFSKDNHFEFSVSILILLPNVPFLDAQLF